MAGVSRYSRDPTLRRRQEQFDELEWRCEVDYYAPTIAELREAGIEEAQFQCKRYECMHLGARFKLTRYWSGLNVRDLKRRQTCGQCYGKKVKVRLIFL